MLVVLCFGDKFFKHSVVHSNKNQSAAKNFVSFPAPWRIIYSLVGAGSWPVGLDRDILVYTKRHLGSRLLGLLD